MSTETIMTSTRKHASDRGRWCVVGRGYQATINPPEEVLI